MKNKHRISLSIKSLERTDGWSATTMPKMSVSRIEAAETFWTLKAYRNKAMGFR
ncbi:MAG TPA: hypothetical protein VFD75_17620 [Pyrinomonadaceae bacterium]|nr:hypothetical protein [Pyrinomonadaceae bacterium]